MYDGFFLYKEYIIPAMKVLSKEQFMEFVTAMVLYGICGKHPVINPYSTAFLEQVKASIDACNRRYKRAVANGAKGGRKCKVTKDRILNAVAQHNITTIHELAMVFNCSERTIQRYISKKDIERCLEKERYYQYLKHSDVDE